MTRPQAGELFMRNWGPSEEMLVPSSHRGRPQAEWAQKAEPSNEWPHQTVVVLLLLRNKNNLSKVLTCSGWVQKLKWARAGGKMGWWKAWRQLWSGVLPSACHARTFQGWSDSKILGAEGCSITQHPTIVSLPSILSKYQKSSIWRNPRGRERGGLGALSGFPNSAQHSFPQKIRPLASREKPQGLGAFGAQGKL